MASGRTLTRRAECPRPVLLVDPPGPSPHCVHRVREVRPSRNSRSTTPSTREPGRKRPAANHRLARPADRPDDGTGYPVYADDATFLNATLGTAQLFVVPEPATGAMLGLGLLLLGSGAGRGSRGTRRRRSASAP